VFSADWKQSAQGNALVTPFYGGTILILIVCDQEECTLAATGYIALSYQILVVDDSKLARMSIARALSTLHPGWTRLDAANADEALILAKQSSPHIALLDFNMPGRDGLLLAAELREINPAMPLAVISANHQDEIVQRAHEVGAAFLPKPLTQQALGDFLARAVLQLRMNGS
jgi:CheY-like chemotaxis protein